MSCGSYSYVFLDASFIGRLKNFDATCNAIELFALCSKQPTCVIKMNQFNKTPCNHLTPNCINLDDIFSDEDAIIEERKSNIGKIDLARISADPADVKEFFWVKSTPDSAMFTCDKNILYLCWMNNIKRCCFKAAVKALDILFDGDISKDDRYNTDDMEDGDDPFYNYSTDKRCATHCGQEKTCICFVSSN